MSLCLVSLTVLTPVGFAKTGRTESKPEAIIVKDGKVSFHLLNKSKQSIFKLYARPHGSESWGKNYLAEDWIDDQENMKFVLEGKETCRDLKIETEDDQVYEFTEGYNFVGVISVMLMADKEGKIKAHALPSNYAACED